MRRGRTLAQGACCVLLVMALAAVAASSASAEVPELGRCVPAEKTEEGKKTVYNGAYKNKGCTKPSATKTGKYEWLPGPGAEGKAFKGGAAEPTIETPGGIAVECGGGEVEGEYTGPKTATIKKLELKPCVTNGVPARFCQTDPGKPDQITNAVPIEAELGKVSGGKAGWDLKASGPMFVYTCGDKEELPESLNMVEGSVIGVLRAGATSNYDRMNKFGFVRFKQAAGKQLPEAFEGGSPDTLTLTRIEGVSQTAEPVGFAAVPEMGTAEPLEVKGK